MGLNRIFCFFIICEQFIFSNIQIVKSLESFFSYGFTSYTYVWVQLFLSFQQILVGAILTFGLIERKYKVFIPWLVINALCGIFITFLDIISFFKPALITDMLGIYMSNSIMHFVLHVITILQWCLWATVLKYYLHLKKKVNEEDKSDAESNYVNNLNKNDDNSTEISTENKYEKPALYNEEYLQQKYEENVVMQKIYPMIPWIPNDAKIEEHSEIETV